MPYPEKGAKYAGEDRVSKLCRAEGGAVSPRGYISGEEFDQINQMAQAVRRSAEGSAPKPPAEGTQGTK